MQKPLDGRCVFTENGQICLQRYNREIIGASWEFLSQIVPSKAECFVGLIIFIRLVEPGI